VEVSDAGGSEAVDKAHAMDCKGEDVARYHHERSRRSDANGSSHPCSRPAIV